MDMETSELEEWKKQESSELFDSIVQLRKSGKFHETAKIATKLSTQYCTYLTDEQKKKLVEIFTDLDAMRKRQEEFQEMIRQQDNPSHWRPCY
ncbi:MAG TPA: hypothetical protein VHA78_00430 [Candidatus Peribacteraceae bacterium]|nr:hypothetical protein [Candidatus Peribacteraceae bacterium]